MLRTAGAILVGLLIGAAIYRGINNEDEILNNDWNRDAWEGSVGSKVAPGLADCLWEQTIERDSEEVLALPAEEQRQIAIEDAEYCGVENPGGRT